MWYLVPKSAPDDRLLLAPNREVVIGRSEGHVTVDDRSVSRRHARLSVQLDPGASQTESRVVLKDTSKFGTLVNGRRVVGDARDLSNGDVIVFGAENTNNFILKHEPLIVCCSAVNGVTRTRVKEVVSTLGGKVLADWTEECTLLVVSKVSVTVKVIGALIRGTPVVRPEYLDHLAEFHVGKRTTQPDPSCYQPAVSADSQHLENIHIDLLPRPERRHLFAPCTFIFLTKKRFDRLSSSLLLGGARCLLWDQMRPTSDDSQLVADNTLVFFESEASPWVKHVYSVLKKHRRRPIEDAEIGFAVLVCSRDEFCNVTKKCDQLLHRQGLTMDLTQNPFDISSQTPAVLDSTSVQTTTTAASTITTSTVAAAARREIKSEPKFSATLLVPRTPSPSPFSIRSPPVPNTSITVVPESMEPKIEAPWSAELVRHAPGAVTAAEEEEEEEDPFDRIQTRGKRRREDSIGSRPAPLVQPEPPTVVREEFAEVAEIPKLEKPQSASGISADAEAVTVGTRGRDSAEALADVTVKRRRSEAAEAREEEVPPAGTGSVADGGGEATLPRNCAQVLVVPLLRPSVAVPRDGINNVRPGARNFKQFRKVRTSVTSRRGPSIVLVASEKVRPLVEAVPISQGPANSLDSQAERLFEEMRQMPARRRR